MKKIFSSIACLAAAALISLGLGSPVEAATKFINIGTGGTAGTYYPLGGAMADIFNKNVPNCNASAQSTGASVANVNLLAQGKVDIAFIQNDIAYYALNGVEMFNGRKLDGLRGLATIYPETVQIIANKSSNITSVKDFKGKRIAVGAAGSGAEANARQVMSAYGISYKDCTIRYLSFAEAASALKDGNVDAAFLTAGYPTAAVQDVSTTNDIVLVPVDDNIAKILIEKYPFYTKTTIPANTYNKQTAPVKAMSVKCMLVVNSTMDDETSFALTKALYENLDRMKAAHVAANAISAASAKDGMSIPMANGAAKYFK